VDTEQIALEAGRLVAVQGRGLLLQGLRVPVDTSNSQTGSTAVDSAR
jgi:hypothetical protein